jgi:hypothetical protein
MPEWAPEKTMYLRAFDLADIERIFADEFPDQVQTMVAHFKNLPRGVPAMVLFSAPGGEPLRLYSGENGIFPAITDCADLGHVLAAVWWHRGTWEANEPKPEHSLGDSRRRRIEL